MALVSNAPTVAAKSSTMLTLYAGIVGNAADMAVKALQSGSFDSVGWAQPALMVVMIVAAVCRVIKQESLSGPTPPPSPLMKE
jgi:hypothetical protein